MIINAWKLDKRPSYCNQNAWSAELGSAPAKKKGRTLGEKEKKPGTYQNAPFGTDSEPVNYSTSNNPNRGNLRSKKKQNLQDECEDVLCLFRNKMAARGTRGIMSMRRAFMIADDDNSKTIDINEFNKFCHDYRIGINESQIKELFEKFDRNGNGTIDYDEFCKGVVPPMNQVRVDIVRKAFEKMDKNGNGCLEVDDIKGTYDASKVYLLYIIY